MKKIVKNIGSAAVVSWIGLWAALGLADSRKTGAPIAVTAADLKWDAIPDSGGVTMTGLEGDIDKSGYRAFIKFPAGAAYPLHLHSADLRIVVLSGSYLYGLEGEAAKKYGPGSYIFIPGGAKHTSGCDAGSACVFYQEQPAKFDEIEAAKTGKSGRK